MSEVCVDPAGLLQRRLDTIVRLPPWHFVLAPRQQGAEAPRLINSAFTKYLKKRVANAMYEANLLGNLFLHSCLIHASTQGTQHAKTANYG